MHIPVFLAESLEALAIDPNGIYIDATFGRGGHSAAILEKLDQGRLIVVDKDPEAIAVAKEKFSGDQRVTICHGSFAQLEEFAIEHEVKGNVAGVLMDLGVSSPQLDIAERGFSFMRDGPLDMRMDTTQGITAADFLADVDEKALATILKEFGEERFSKRIARAIVSTRDENPLTRTKQLADLIASAVPRKEKHKHPATRSFQAIRIVLNNELQELRDTLQQALDVLAPKGRLVVISFHSLEDRIVKVFMKEKGGKTMLAPRGLPLTEAQVTQMKELHVLGKVKPSQQELVNVRARSAILRFAEKVLKTA